MKELIVKPSFSNKITVNSEYLEKQLLELSIKGGYHYELFEYALNQYRLRPWLYDIYSENLLLLKVLRWVDMGFQLIGILLQAQILRLQSHFLNFS